MKFHAITLTLLMLAVQISLLLAVPAPNEVRWIAAPDRQAVDLAVEVKTMEGTTVSLTDYRNCVVFVNVWATWCKPCKEELPALAKVYDILRHEGFEVLAITNDDAKKVRGFLKKIPLPFTILIDTKEKVFNRFKVDRVPTALVIDRTGKLALRHTGPVDWTSPAIIDALRSLTKQPADE